MEQAFLNVVMHLTLLRNLISSVFGHISIEIEFNLNDVFKL